MQPYPVPAVRAIIVNEQNRVLLLRREESTQGGGQWCLPGGKVDYGQLVEEAVKREIGEETQLKCLRAIFLFYQDSPPLVPGGMHCINFVFQCSVEGNVILNDESIDYAWIQPNQRDNYSIAFRNDEILRRFYAGDTASE